jgi:hypothetical protein
MSISSIGRVSTGIIKVTNDGVRIITGFDLVRYYQWLINKGTYNTIKNQLPKFGAHVTILNKTLHNFSVKEASQFHNQQLEFIYFPEKIYQSRVNFWIPVECPRALEIKKILKVTDKDFWGLHLTVCNRKFDLTNKK